MTVTVYCECGAVMEEIGPDLVRCPRCKVEVSLPVSSVGTSWDAEPSTGERAKQDVQVLVENIRRAAKALEDKLTPNEAEQILRAVEVGAAALRKGDLRACEESLSDLEASASLISAVLRRG